jgi:hypothetical protein
MTELSPGAGSDALWDIQDQRLTISSKDGYRRCALRPHNGAESSTSPPSWRGRAADGRQSLVKRRA